MDIKQAKKLFKKYINNECSPKEIQLLEVFLDSYQDKNDIWPDLKIGKEEALKTKLWSRIESKINETKKNKERSIRSIRPYLKYVAAAVFIGVFVSSYFFSNIFDRAKESETPIIVETNTIVPGTDKATLTLGDGSVVVLQKGKTFQTRNATSNGEEITYDHTEKQEQKVVYNYLTIPRGGQFFIKLSDGTSVWLNSESQLKYPVNFIEGKVRKVELVYGEAYFDVSPAAMHKGTKFQVFNEHQEVEVVGTEFNVKAYRDESNILTTLVEGEVHVKSGDSKQVLEPNQQLNLNLENKSLTVSRVDVYNEISWKDGVFSFRKLPLEDIMKVLSRWYDVDVHFENPKVKSEGFNGVLGKDQNIEDILNIIKDFKTIESYEIKGKQIIIK